jgi:L-amino acid N-acyltransferase YncA
MQASIATAVTFQQEKWASIKGLMVPLTQRHWLEVGLDQKEIPLDIDDDLYNTLEHNGLLHITTARDGEKLIGYFIMCVRTHPHYRTTLCAFLDSYFIHADCRDPWTGIGLFEAMEQAMRSLGVKKMIAGMKLHKDVSVLFDRLGWTPIETTFAKYIG